MTAVQQAPVHHSRRSPARRWVRWAVLVSAFVALAIWWWLPRRYHPVGRYAAYDANLLPCASGFFVREGVGQFALRDWRDGAVRWRVRVPAPNFVGRHTPNPSLCGHLFSVSPDGRTFAALILQGARTRVQTWREDRRVSDFALPNFPPYPSFVRALDSGRVFVWTWGQAVNPVVAIEDGVIVARGSVPDAATIAPDGSAVLSYCQPDFVYSPLLIERGQILLPQRREIADGIIARVGFTGLGMEDAYLYSVGAAQFADGIVMTNAGAIYHPLSGDEPAAEWRHTTISPAGVYTVQDNGMETRMFSPVTGDAWQFTVRGRYQGGDATDDGRYALVDYLRNRPELPRWVEQVVRKAPWLGRFVPDASWECLLLYERPGNVRALLPLHRSGNRPLWEGGGAPLPLETWCPSPDGHSLAAIGYGRRGRECLLFRW